MNLKAMLEQEEEQYQRRQREKAERVAKGLSEPARTWTPPTAEELAAQQARLFGKRRKRRSTAKPANRKML